MKTNRITFLVLLVSSLIFIYFYGGKVPYMFFYTIVSLAVVSTLYTAVIIFRFKYIQRLDKNFVMKGDNVNFLFSVHNEDFLFYPYIRVRFFGSETLFKKQFQSKSFSLPPFKEKNYSFELECKYRGCYEIGLKSFEIEDFLGIIRFKYNINQTKMVTVYPRVIYLDRFYLKTNFESDCDPLLSHHSADSNIISDIRKYAYGDSMRKIHWKLTAKAREMMIKNFESTSESGAVMILDLKENKLTPEENIILEDKLIEATVAVAYFCLSNWIPVHLLYYKDEIVDIEAKNLSSFDEIYSILSKVQFGLKIDVCDILDVHFLDTAKKTNVIIFTCNLTENLYSEIHKLKYSGFQVSVLYVSDEDITGFATPQSDHIISCLTEAGVDAYKINIHDDLKTVLER